MKSVVSKSYILGAVAVLGLTVAVQAAPTVELAGDTGTWRVTTYDAANVVTGTGSNPLINPYGVPPVPAITGTTSFNLVLTPTADFMAYASNSGGAFGKTVQMDGKLDLYITMDSAVQLTTNIYEDGIYSTTGNGTFSVIAGAKVTPVDPVTHVALETAMANNPANYAASGGGWSLYEKVPAFDTAYTTYKISIDNTLLAEALSSQTSGSAYAAKKDFTLIFTTDGSSGGGPNVPEPASLGVLALGGMGLLARRRKA